MSSFPFISRCWWGLVSFGDVDGEDWLADVCLLCRGGLELPANWEKVVLDKKAIEKLVERGIAYYQERIRGGVVEEFEEMGA